MLQSGGALGIYASMESLRNRWGLWVNDWRGAQAGRRFDGSGEMVAIYLKVESKLGLEA
jgi:hypothetical protein